LCRTISAIECGPYQSVNKTAADVVRFAGQLRTQASTMARVIEEQVIDTLYINGPRVLPAAIWARRGRPVVFHSHSVVAQGGAAMLAGQALRWSDSHVLASSRFVATWLAPFVSPNRMQVIYNGIASRNVAPQPRARHTRVGVLGRIAPEKGQLTFVRAARIVAATDPDLTFVIAGAPMFGSQSYFEQVQNEAGPRVDFIGWTENIAEFFARIDLLVVPSEAVDANPRVIPEAYAAGVPVLAFDFGGIAELVAHNDTGILVPEHSSAALAAAMLDSVRRPLELNRMALNGYQRWQQLYTLARFQSDVCDALERVVETKLHKVRTSASA
jgi:glycosyltransferase involved in cell wall biosynthesis